MEFPNVVEVAMEARRVGHFLDARRLAQCVSAGQALTAHPNLWTHFMGDIEQLFNFVAEKKGGTRKRKLDVERAYKLNCRGSCCTGPRPSIIINLPCL